MYTYRSIVSEYFLNRKFCTNVERESQLNRTNWTVCPDFNQRSQIYNVKNRESGRFTFPYLDGCSTSRISMHVWKRQSSRISIFVVLSLVQLNYKSGRFLRRNYLRVERIPLLNWTTSFFHPTIEERGNCWLNEAASSNLKALWAKTEQIWK